MLKSRIRPALLATLVAVAASLAAGDTLTPARNDSPAIIVITVDTLRADRLGAYGYKRVATPAVDSLAADGVLFERAIAQVPLTWPSHAAILTGTYPFFNGVQDFTGQTLSADVRTLAESLQSNGYATGAVVSAFVLDRSWGLARGFDHYYDAFSGQAFGQRALGLVDRRAAESVDRALEWLEKRPDKRFFLWLHLFDPHSPYDPPEPFRSRYRARPYDGEVAYVDQQLGRLFAWLKKKKLYDSALIVLLSDHGESLGEHGEDEHGFFVYNSTIHVPLIVKPPAAAGYEPRRVAAPVETIRVAPTVLRLAGVRDPIQRQFQAGSLLALMQRGRETSPRPAYAETFYPFASFGWSPLRSVQTRQHHYIEAPEAELYDLSSDPAETDNLAANVPNVPARGAGVQSKLRSELRRLVGRYQAGAPKPGETNLSPDAMAKLRSLGYVASRAPNPAGLQTEDLADPKRKIETYQNILRATDAFQLGRYAAGRALLRKVQETDPQLYLVPFLLGEAATRQRDWPGATRHFTRTLKLNPEFDEAMIGLARALGQTGKSKEAERWLRKALDANPRNYRAWFQLSRIQAASSPAAARVSLVRTLSIQPNFAPAHYDFGMLEIQQQRFAEAAQHLEQAVALGLTTPEIYNFLGIAYNRSNRAADAVEAYGKALVAKPDYAEAHLNLALALQRLHREAEARREYGAACRLKKEFCRYMPGRNN